MSSKYKFGERTGAYFVSFATVNWIVVFTRDAYFRNIIESLDFCRKNKAMEIYTYCIMPSHIQLLFRSGNGDPSVLMRDFKGFTSRLLLCRFCK
jgi:REP element-mobilizing transposase RayT